MVQFSFALIVMCVAVGFVGFSIFCYYELYKELIRKTKTFNTMGPITIIFFGSLSSMNAYVHFTRAYEIIVI